MLKTRSKALIISDPIMDSLGFVKKCHTLLKNQGLEVVSYLGVTTEPDDTYVAEGLQLCRKKTVMSLFLLGVVAVLIRQRRLQ